MNITETDGTISSAITTGSSLISAFCGLLIIWSYSAIKTTQNTVRGMLVALTIADVLTAFGLLIASARWFVFRKVYSNGSDNLCIVQSYITTYSNMASFFWTMFIAGYLFCCVWLRKVPRLTWARSFTLHAIAWGIPGIITTVAASIKILGNDGFGPNGAWCWLKFIQLKKTSPNHALYWGLLAGKGWEILTYVTTMVLYFLMKVKTYFERKRRVKQGMGKLSWDNISRELRREDELFCFTWLILYCLRIWGTIRFILTVINYYDDHLTTDLIRADRVFLYFQSYGDSSQAFWNFILFCVCDKTVRLHVLKGTKNVETKTFSENNLIKNNPSIRFPRIVSDSALCDLRETDKLLLNVGETAFFTNNKAKTF